MKLFSTFLLTLLFAICYAQKTPRSKYLKIISAGFCEDESKNCISKQINYLNACDWLGHYYIQLKKYTLAFKYYSLPAELNGHNTEFRSDSAIHIRSKVLAKAGDMLLLGQGMKKDTGEAFFYHLQIPYTLSESFKSKYSNIYFGSVKDTIVVSVQSNGKELTKIIGLNPFFINDIATISKLRKEIASIEPMLSSDSSSKCVLEMFYGGLPLTEEGQATAQLFLARAGKEIKALHPKRVETNLEIDADSYDQRIITGISIPLFKIIVTL